MKDIESELVKRSQDFEAGLEEPKEVDKTLPIWVVSCDGMPTLFFRKATEGEVKTEFSTGFSPDTCRSYTDHPSFQVRLLTMELLLDLAPVEFQLYPDTGF